MSSVFTLVHPPDLHEAHRRALPKAIAFSLDTFLQSAPDCECEQLALYPEQLLAGAISDSAELQAFLYSIRQYARVLQGGRDAHWPNALHHLELDAEDVSRVADLLRYQSLGLAIAQAIMQGSALEFRTVRKPPPFLAMPFVGTLFFPGEVDGFEVVVRDQEALFRHAGGVARIRLEDDPFPPPPLRFVRAVRCVVGEQPCEVPVHDPALAQPGFQSLPLLRGREAVSLFAAEISESSNWLSLLGLPNLAQILSWCRACLGLVSFGEHFGSGSRMEALGLIYLPVGRPLYELAECLLHEAMHQHLFRLGDVAPLFEPASDRKEHYYSPWRNDPRPLLMTLHGAFVFTAVAELYRSALDHPEAAVPEEHAIRSCYRRARQALVALDVVTRYANPAKAGVRVIAQTTVHAQRILAAVGGVVGTAICQEIDRELAAHRESCREYLG